MAENGVNVCKDVEKKLHSGVERKDLMVLKTDSMCNLEENVMPAATSIAILGQIMAIATKTDFSLKNATRVKDFKHVKDPGSFRACLVQICNSVCDAFMEAHKSMDKIGMYTIRFQQNIKHVVTILLSGSEREKKNNLPIFLESLKEDATKCTNLAKTTEDKFVLVIELIDEICESSEAVKGCYENDVTEARKMMTKLEMEKKEIEAKRLEIDNERKRIIEEVAKAKVDFEKSIDQVPGVAKILAMSTVEDTMKMATGAIGLYAEFQMMAVSKGVYAVTSLVKKCSGEKTEKSNQSDNVTNKQPELNLAFLHATKFHKCIEMMYKMFREKENIEENQEIRIDLDSHATLEEIKKALMQMKTDFEKSELPDTPTVPQIKSLFQDGIDVCEEMLQKSIDEDADDLFKKVTEIKGRSKALDIKARHMFHHSNISIPSTAKSETNTESKRNFELASENARYVVEIRRKELEEAKEAREKFYQKVEEMNERQSKVLYELSKTNIDEIKFEDIQKTLRDGLGALGELKEQWNYLVLFFCNISNAIDACLTPETCQIEKVFRKNEYDIGCATRDIALEMAGSVNSVAYSVGMIAQLYTNISKQHLVPNIASLGKLIAYDPVTEKDKLDMHRKRIDEDCRQAKEKIKVLTQQSRKEMEDRIESMDRRLKEQEEKLPKLSSAKLLEIKENVENRDISDYI